VTSLAELVAFGRELSANPEDPAAAPFLEALARWIEDSYLTPGDPPHEIDGSTPTWSLFATMLAAGDGYE